MKFSRALRDAWTQDGDRWSCEIPQGWTQGRSVFGGVTGAVATALAHRVVDPSRALRTMNLQMFRPVSDGSMDASVRLIREGKSVSFAEVSLRQNDLEVAAGNFVFVAGRAGATPVVPVPRSIEPPVDDLVDLPYIEGITPKFTKNFRLRWANGGMPYSKSKHARFEGYSRFRDAADGEEALIALLDVWPTPSLAVLAGPAPASTVTWTAHILSVPESFDEWFGFSYETLVGRDGFHTCAGQLLSSTGELMAWTEQLVAVFDS